MLFAYIFGLSVATALGHKIAPTEFFTCQISSTHTKSCVKIYHYDEGIFGGIFTSLAKCKEHCKNGPGCHTAHQVKKPLPVDGVIHTACALNLEIAHGTCRNSCQLRFLDAFIDGFCEGGKCVCKTCGSMFSCVADSVCEPCTLNFDCPNRFVYSNIESCEEYCPLQKTKFYCERSDTEGDQCKECKIFIDGENIGSDCPAGTPLFTDAGKCDKLCEREEGCHSKSFWNKIEDDYFCLNDTAESVAECASHCDKCFGADPTLEAACAAIHPGAVDALELRVKRDVPSHSVLHCFCRVCNDKRHACKDDKIWGCYASCEKTCGKTCPDPKPNCVEGCYCPEGLYEVSGGRCLELADCGLEK